ncbi:FtsX-like permease family protein [Faecalimonas sp.]
MKKKALRKDFYMEIKRSLGRFLSIFFIVVLGVSFFSGIRAAEPDMRLSADEYFDTHHLADIKVISTLGLTKKDIEAIRKVDGVKNVEYGYSTDAICRLKDSEKVVHIMSNLSTLNQVDVLEGRMPQKENECFMDIDFMKKSGYKIGDSIKLESGTGKDLNETLKNSNYKIVGTGSSPCYISFERGSSMIGTGEVSGFIVVLPQTFSTKVYTECLIEVDGAREEIAFTKEYDSKVKKVKKKVEEIETLQCQQRKKEIITEAQDKVSKAEKELQKEKETAIEKLNAVQKKISDGERQLINGKKQLREGKENIAAAKKTISKKETEFLGAKKQYKTGMNQLQQGKKTLEEKEKEFQKQYNEACQGTKTLQGTIQTLEKSLVSQKNQYISTQKEIAGLNPSIPEEKEQIEALEKQLEIFESAIKKMEIQLNSLKQQLKEIETKLSLGRNSINQAKKEIMRNEERLKEIGTQITFGEKQLQHGKTELFAKEKELKQAEEIFAKNEKELDKGKKEYLLAKKKMETEISNGEKKIQDAKKEIKDIENPKWYVNDRDVFPEYRGYGENAERIKAIGRVFPLIFFLVATLISLTTMTRMVEEQRTQIGTMKALGYNRLAIAKKYINYALFATAGGSVIGVLIGEKLYPYVIVFSYQIMYTHMPNIVIPYNIKYAVIATVAAVTCTMFATIVSCYKELAEQPAVLMRPPSPKQGKRVFLERIPFIWKKFSFIWKSTIRNLVRYKKRFFMTVFGIGGCMALILVGYGLKDSIFSVSVRQYDEIQQYHLQALLNEDASEKEKQALERYKKNQNEIKDSLQIHIKNVRIGKENIEKEVYLYIPEDQKKFADFVQLKDRKTDKQYALTEDGAVLTEKMARILNVDVGDRIFIKGESGEKKEVIIKAICENYMGHYLYLTKGMYEKLYNEKPSFNSELYKLKTVDKKTTLQIGEDMLGTKAVINMQYTDSLRTRIEDMLKTLNSVIVVLIVAAGMLAFVVLYNLNNINITERKRELATIKVLGFYDGEVAAYVYRENILLTLIGAFAGCGMGYLLHRFVIVTVEIDDVMFGRDIHFVSYMIALIFTFGFSIFVNWIMYYKLKKISMVESLKSVE